MVQASATESALYPIRFGISIFKQVVVVVGSSEVVVTGSSVVDEVVEDEVVVVHSANKSRTSSVPQTPKLSYHLLHIHIHRMHSEMFRSL